MSYSTNKLHLVFCYKDISALFQRKPCVLLFEPNYAAVDIEGFSAAKEVPYKVLLIYVPDKLDPTVRLRSSDHSMLNFLSGNPLLNYGELMFFTLLKPRLKDLDSLEIIQDNSKDYNLIQAPLHSSYAGHIDDYTYWIINWVKNNNNDTVTKFLCM